LFGLLIAKHDRHELRAHAGDREHVAAVRREQVAIDRDERALIELGGPAECIAASLSIQSTPRRYRLLST
jgi:hypothetical protein